MDTESIKRQLEENPDLKIASKQALEDLKNIEEYGVSKDGIKKFMNSFKNLTSIVKSNPIETSEDDLYDAYPSNEIVGGGGKKYFTSSRYSNSPYSYLQTRYRKSYYSTFYEKWFRGISLEYVQNLDFNTMIEKLNIKTREQMLAMLTYIPKILETGVVEREFAKKTSMFGKAKNGIRNLFTRNKLKGGNRKRSGSKRCKTTTGRIRTKKQKNNKKIVGGMTVVLESMVGALLGSACLFLLYFYCKYYTCTSNGKDCSMAKDIDTGEHFFTIFLSRSLLRIMNKPLHIFVFILLGCTVLVLFGLYIGIPFIVVGFMISALNVIFVVRDVVEDEEENERREANEQRRLRHEEIGRYEERYAEHLRQEELKNETKNRDLNSDF